MIRLNVGGHKYDTTLDTLCRVKDSMLAVMFSGQFAATKIKGRHFIDRDGALFAHILRYLRDGSEYSVPQDRQLARDLLTEARYYGLSELISSLNSVAEKKSRHSFAAYISDSNHVRWSKTVPEEVKFSEALGCPAEYAFRIVEKAESCGYALAGSTCWPRGRPRANRRARNVGIFLFFAER